MRGRILGFATENIAEVTVEYADYVIARGFIEAFDEWLKGCKSEPDILALKFAQRWSHLAPKVLQLGASIGIGFYALSAVPEFISNPIDIQIVARFLIIFSVGFFVITRLAIIAGGMLEEAIDSYSVISYLKLNNGDEKLITEYSKKRRKIFAKFVVGSVFTLLLGIASSKLAVII